MEFTSDDIQLYKAIENSESSTNGGIISSTQSVSGIRGNIFPDVSDTERSSGGTLWRKVFWKNTNSNNLTLRSVKALMTEYTPGDDVVVFCPGTYNDTQSIIENTSKFYGAGGLKIDIAVGGTSLIVILENSNIIPFTSGDTIRISNNVTSEYHSNITVGILNGNELTLHLSNGDSFQYNYINSATIISSVATLNDLIPSYTNLSLTSTTGIFDNNNYDLELYNIGCIYQNWTIKFFSSTQFTLNGNTLGYVGNGSTLLDFAPINPLTSMPYFYISNDIWQGLWSSNDEIKFLTIPATVSLWFKRIIPSGSQSTYNKFKHIIRGQAATQ